MADTASPNGPERLYLDDLHVGQQFTSGTRSIDAADIVAFAREFDPQPFHTDLHAAEDSFFGGLVASGWHTASISMRLLVESLPIAGGLIGAGGEIVWTKPVRPGMTLRVESTITEIRTSRRFDRGRATVRSETRNELDEVVQICIAKLVVPRRPTETNNP